MFNFFPSMVSFSPSGPDRMHALAVQALLQDREDNRLIGEIEDINERRRERLRVMREEEEQRKLETALTTTTAKGRIA